MLRLPAFVVPFTFPFLLMARARERERERGGNKEERGGFVQRRGGGWKGGKKLGITLCGREWKRSMWHPLTMAYVYPTPEGEKIPNKTFLLDDGDRHTCVACAGCEGGSWELQGLDGVVGTVMWSQPSLTVVTSSGVVFSRRQKALRDAARSSSRSPARHAASRSWCTCMPQGRCCWSGQRTRCVLYGGTSGGFERVERRD